MVEYLVTTPLPSISKFTNNFKLLLIDLQNIKEENGVISSSYTIMSYNLISYHFEIFQMYPHCLIGHFYFEKFTKEIGYQNESCVPKNKNISISKMTLHNFNFWISPFKKLKTKIID